MKALLTGEVACNEFHFIPTKVGLLANKVFVEGHGRGEKSWWVHVWTVTDGKITQLREYYNTAIMVANYTSASPCCSGNTTSPGSISGGSYGTWSTSANSLVALHVGFLEPRPCRACKGFPDWAPELRIASSGSLLSINIINVPF
jgi:hypothetical protein